MPRKRHKPEEIVAKLRQVDVLVSQGQSGWPNSPLTHRLPSVFGPKYHVKAGGLMSYWPDRADNWRRGASYVDSILKGASPADLPVQQPTKFDLVFNLKTAKALGLTIPPTLLARADEVIE